MSHGNVRYVEALLEDAETRSRLKAARRGTKSMARAGEKMRIVDRIEITQSTMDAEIDLVELTTVEVKSVHEEYPEVNVSLTAPDSVPILGESSVRHAIAEEDDQVSQVVEDNEPGTDQAELVTLETKEETSLVHGSGVGLWPMTWLTEYFGGRFDFE